MPRLDYLTARGWTEHQGGWSHPDFTGVGTREQARAAQSHHEATEAIQMNGERAVMRELWEAGWTRDDAGWTRGTTTGLTLHEAFRRHILGEDR